MRQWFGVYADEMCPTHLKRELMETIQIVNVARGEWNIEPETAVRKLAGHAARGQIDTSEIEDRWIMIVEELDRRELQRPKNCPREPPEYPQNVPHFRGKPQYPRQDNIQRLSMKCNDCFENR